jgi:hypothetical protein
VFALVSLPPIILAKPKSDILGFISSFKRILLVFISLWMILNWSHGEDKKAHKLFPK